VTQARFLVLFLLLAASSVHAKNPVSPAGDNGAASIQYEISLANPERHLFHVEMKVPDVSGELTVQIPSWNALYQIRDFSSHMQQVEARIGSDKVPI